MTGSLTNQQKEKLLKLSRDTISLYLKSKKVLSQEITDPALKEQMGAFVTLRKNDQLRGCIGNIIARKPFYLEVIDMSIASSTQDPRFAPVRQEELKDITIEISAISPLKKISSCDEIVLGVHGVLIRSGFRSGVYLPQVATETGWNKEEFMSSLCVQKAGIEADAWKTGKCDIYIFSAQVFSE